MLSNVVRLLSIRSVLTLGVNLSRSQLLKSNRSLNRLRHITIHSDLHINLASRLLRLKGLLTLSQNSLTISLANQLSLQRVFLTRNQTFEINGIDHSGISNDLMGSLSEISIRRNLRLQILLRIPRGYGLILIFDVLVLSNVVRLLSIRSVLTLSVNLS